MFIESSKISFFLWNENLINEIPSCAYNIDCKNKDVFSETNNFVK